MTAHRLLFDEILYEGDEIIHQNSKVSNSFRISARCVVGRIYRLFCRNWRRCIGGQRGTKWTMFDKLRYWPLDHDCHRPTKEIHILISPQSEGGHLFYSKFGLGRNRMPTGYSESRWTMVHFLIAPIRVQTSNDICHHTCWVIGLADIVAIVSFSTFSDALGDWRNAFNYVNIFQWWKVTIMGINSTKISACFPFVGVILESIGKVTSLLTTINSPSLSRHFWWQKFAFVLTK